MGNFNYGTQTDISASRSVFDVSHKHLTSFNHGDLVPIYLQEVVPGDTFDVVANCFIRTSTPWVKAPMDNLYIDIHFFFVPNRLVWEEWQVLMGENKDTAFYSDNETLEVPHIVTSVPTSSENAKSWTNTLADYFGVLGSDWFVEDAESVESVSVSVLPFRGYSLIYDRWFRDQNIQNPQITQIGGILTSGNTESFNTNEFSNVNYTGYPARVNRLHDYFSSSLPAPQKGNSVDVAVNASGVLRVLPISEEANIDFSDSYLAMRFMRTDGTYLPEGTTNSLFSFAGEGSGEESAVLGVDSSQTSTGASSFAGVMPTNLAVDLSSNDSNSSDLSMNINDFRQAYALQKVLELDARGGTRYIELIASHFKVVSSDARLNYPEYLGGSRDHILITEVIQTSLGLDGNTPQGNVAAYTKSLSKSGFSKAFEEHGMIIGVACVRHKHTYQQGIQRYWMKSKRFDFYLPGLANIGEQPILTHEIYNYNNSKTNVFGYAPAWEHMRYMPNRVSGFMRSGAKDIEGNTQSLDVWHFGDNYANSPTLSDEWLKESAEYVDRCLSVSAFNSDYTKRSSSNHYIADFVFKGKMIRPMPAYGIPK